ncbi:hypothetical protein C0Q70_14749 [Pomacea canaliculata]|uniref:EGF-like domain-containing protein n=1 Tax=Pomacea canaliculata TaxID=400727 RepID=A0A2T7NSZ3_POMCA|nr:hypothetical protein C0Q70_14749 [Pomacea canaliculata]
MRKSGKKLPYYGNNSKPFNACLLHTAVKENKIGGSCSSDSCGANAECSAPIDGKCRCKEGFTGKDDDEACSGIPANMVGGQCTAGSCVGNNVECPASGSKFCKCKDGFTGASEAAGCNTVMADRIGGKCTSTSSCGANAVCSASADGVCKCQEGFSGKDGDATCTVKENKIGGSCSSDSCGANAECSAPTDGKCRCKEGFTGSDGDEACSLPGRDGNGEPGLPGLPGTEGPESPPGIAGVPGSDGGPAVKENKIGGSCSSDSCGANAECSAPTDGKCRCKEGFTGRDGDEACSLSGRDGNGEPGQRVHKVPQVLSQVVMEDQVCGVDANTVGGPCTAGTCHGNNVECLDNVECGNKFCKCKDGFTGTIGAAGCDTVIADRIGGKCTSTSSCGANAVCSASADGVCKCQEGFSGKDGDATCTVMANRIGGSCVTSSCGANAECSSSGVCTCVNGFTGQAGDIACSQSGGAAHSVATWFLASITSMIACML